MIKAAELKGDQLDYWVARAEGEDDPRIDGPFGCCITMPGMGSVRYRPSKDWEEAGPIIEREQLAAVPGVDGSWRTHKMHPTPRMAYAYAGATLLESAMRCYVASTFGDSFDANAVPAPDENTVPAPNAQGTPSEPQETRLPATIEFNSEDKDAWV